LGNRIAQIIAGKRHNTFDFRWCYDRVSALPDNVYKTDKGKDVV
jgi:hypothetical protein